MVNKLKKGFTLVELIVVLMLMGIITTAIAMVIRPTTELYIDINNKTTEENAAITLFDVINGELRYALDVALVSNNDPTAIPPSGVNYERFIMLSNTKREGQHLDAYGYVKHGKVSDFAHATNVTGSNQLENLDVKWSISDVVISDGNQSITINALMHQMKSDGLRIDKEYNYSETLRLLNLQKKANIKANANAIVANDYHADKVSEGISALLTEPYNTSTDGEQVIWILYNDPKDDALENVGGSTSASGFQAFNTDPKDSGGTKGDKSLNLGEQAKYIKLHVQSGQYKLYSKSGSVEVCKPDGSAESNPDQLFSVKDYYIKLGEGASFGLGDQNGNPLDPEAIFTSDDAEAGLEKWIYNNTVNDVPYEDPAAINVTKKLHYIYHPSDNSKGFQFAKNDPSDGISSRVNGSDIQQWGATYIPHNSANADFDINLTKSNAKVKVRATGDWGNGVYYEFDIDETSPDELWICNGLYYESADAVPEIPMPHVTATITYDECTLSQYGGNVKYTVTLTNDSDVPSTAWGFSFDVAGPLNTYYWGMNGLSCSLNSNMITVENQTLHLAAHETKTISIDIGGFSGVPDTNPDNYEPQNFNVWC